MTFYELNFNMCSDEQRLTDDTLGCSRSSTHLQQPGGECSMLHRLSDSIRSGCTKHTGFREIPTLWARKLKRGLLGKVEDSLIFAVMKVPCLHRDIGGFFKTGANIVRIVHPSALGHICKNHSAQLETFAVGLEPLLSYCHQTCLFDSEAWTEGTAAELSGIRGLEASSKSS